VRRAIRPFAGIGLLLAACLGSLPAAALESLEGVYAAKLSCKGIAGTLRGKYKFEAQLVIEQVDAGNVLFELDGLPNGTGYLLTDGAKPDTGTLEAVSCPLGAANYQGGALHADVKTKAGGASLKGTLLIFDHALLAGNVCKITAKRTGTGPVKLVGCTT
jgi:hypothetical protein